jgi:hypothetical protein
MPYGDRPKSKGEKDEEEEMRRMNDQLQVGDNIIISI